MFKSSQILMRLTHGQKRILIGLATPALALIYWAYRVASLEAFRRRSLPFRRGGKPQTFPKRILVVRLDTIGDVILSEPAVRALKEAYPETRLDVLVGPAGKAILSGNPCIDRFIVYEAPWHAAWRGQKVNWPSEIVKALNKVHELRRNRYDLAVELRGDPRDIALMAVTGAAIKVGSGWRGGGVMLDIDAGVDADAHRVDFALGIAASAGARPMPSPPRIWLAEAERQVAETHLPWDGSGQRIAMHLGAGFPNKCLPVERFAEVARALAGDSTGGRRRIVVIGGRDEVGLFEEFRALLQADPVDLVGKLSLLETAAILERCTMFIGNDSGPMHIAAAVGTPVVTFFGPSEPKKYRPYMVDHRLIERSLSCRPCDHIHCVQPSNICMTGIEASDIIAAAEEIISSCRSNGEQSA